MGYAVELYFDLPSSRVILDCWEKLSSICLTLNSKPHISLAIFDDIDTGQMEGIVKEFAKNHSPTEIDTYASFGVGGSAALRFGTWSKR